MNFIQNDQIDKIKWQKLLSESNFSSPFQTVEFYDLYNKSENLSADVFSIEENDDYKSLVVVTIQKEKGVKSYFSRRAIIYGGIVMKESEDAICLETLLKNITSYYKNKAIYIEIRNNFDYNFSKPLFIKNNWKCEEHLNVQLSLENTNVEELLAKMKYNRRREIRLSLKEGAAVRCAENDEEVIALYDILKDMYAERVKLPLNSLSFFLDLYNSALGKVFIVTHDHKIIGGSFCLYYDKMTINTLYYTGLRNYHKKIFPTHLAVLGAMEFGLKNKLKTLDLMGAGKPNVAYGVRDYKLKFGGDLVENGRFTYILNPLLFKIGSFGLKVIKRFNF